MNLDHLNPKQREAAQIIDGPLLILAGAGSGKTSTMTSRIAYMIDQGIDPYRMLAVTFTNKAAGEMRERVESLVGPDGARGIWIMTFHAMCLRILRYDGEILGYGPNFVIYDTTDQKTLVKNICKELGISDKEYKPAFFLSIISENKEREISPDEFLAHNPANPKSNAIYQVYSAYEKELRKNNAMDFDDLLLNTVRLFDQDERTLLKYQDRFRYIMVDEYQDTNHIQYKLIKMLTGDAHNICVVGDDDQCIYQWRGADIRNILDFEKDFPEAKVIKLEQNYRSVGNILAAAHSVIENNRDRKRKQLWTDKEEGHKITYQQSENEREEARFVAQEIEMLIRTQGRQYCDFAILYRVNAQSRAFEEVFARAGIPYRVLSGMRYYDRKEIKDMLAYLRLVVNPSDDLSLRRIINEPKRGVGDKTLEKLLAFASARGESLLTALQDEEVLETLSKKSYEPVKAMAQTLNLCRQEKDNLLVSDIYDQLLVKTGYLKTLEDTDTLEAEGRIENLMEFKTVIAGYETESENPNIEEFLEGLTLMSEVDNHDETLDSVVMMTMHSAKGLEFPVVFLPGMEDGLFPGHRAFDSVTGMEEERRLCYVGMTRAKERLFLTSARQRTMYGRTDYARESQFLREVDKKLVDGDSIYTPRASGSMGPGVSTGSIDGYAKASRAGYKPYDALSRAKAATKAAASTGGAPQAALSTGDRVRHTKFGEGTVVALTDSIVTVDFDGAGTKKLGRKVAPLEKR